jgi:hypothetical protein
MACTHSRRPGAAVAALDVKVKQQLQTVADGEQQEWRQAEGPADTAGSGANNRCMPHCGLCAPSGWVGTISCTKTVTGPTYHHKEIQTWYVGGGPPPTSTGETVYPTEWTSTGSGGDGTETWNVNATGAGQLGVLTNAQGLSFERKNSEIVVFDAIQGSPTSYADYEFQFLAFANPIDSHTYTGQPCDAPATPGNASCTVVCDWKLVLQP